MKRIFQTTIAVVAVALMLTACNINEDYDLSNIDGGDFVLGDDDSVFNLPLATVTINVDKLLDGETVTSYSRADYSSSITAQLDLLAALLPSEEYFSGGVDLEKLSTDESYKSDVLDALIEELDDDEEKRTLLSTELLTNEELDSETQASILAELNYTIDPEASTEEQINSLASSIETTVSDDDSAASLKSTISSEISDAGDSGTSLLDDLKAAIVDNDNTSDTITIDDVDVDQTVIDMLKDGSDKLDIRLYYSLDTNITANFDLDISLLFGDGNELEIGKDKDNADFGSISDSDTLESILDELKIQYEITFSTYSGSNNKDERYIKLKLMAKKVGALAF